MLTSTTLALAPITEPPWLDRAAYPFANHQLELPSGRIHYIDEGQGDPILFVHGTPTWSFEFRHLVRALSATHRCVALDHLGFGLSERPADFAYTPEAHAATLAEFVAALGLREFTLVVHDFGGPIALPLALAKPRLVKQLVVINSWMWPFDDDRTVRRWGRVAGSWFGKLLYRELALPLRVLMPRTYGDRTKLGPAIRAQYEAPFHTRASRTRVLWPLARALLGSRNFYASLEDHADELADIPATLIWGMQDPALGGHMIKHWRAMLPHATVIPIMTAGHWPHEECPDEVVAAIRAQLGVS